MTHGHNTPPDPYDGGEGTTELSNLTLLRDIAAVAGLTFDPNAPPEPATGTQLEYRGWLNDDGIAETHESYPAPEDGSRLYNHSLDVGQNLLPDIGAVRVGVTQAQPGETYGIVAWPGNSRWNRLLYVGRRETLLEKAASGADIGYVAIMSEPDANGLCVLFTYHSTDEQMRSHHAAYAAGYPPDPGGPTERARDILERVRQLHPGTAAEPEADARNS